MNFVEILKVIVQGLVEGFTEWLPISSTGHLMLVNALIPLHQPESYYEVFKVVIQLGAIFAVCFRFFHELWPFARAQHSGKLAVRPAKINLWLKIIIACFPAAVLGILFDDFLDAHLNNAPVIAIVLILYGVLFIWIERRNAKAEFPIRSVDQIELSTALLIGLFQCLALIPGTSRSGVTILGAMLIGVSRVCAAEFSFFLSVPIMFGASAVKLIKYFVKGGSFTGSQSFYLILAMLVAFVVSLYCINFLLEFIRKHSFAVFGWYRILLGILVLLGTVFTFLAKIL